MFAEVAGVGGPYAPLPAVNSWHFDGNLSVDWDVAVVGIVNPITIRSPEIAAFLDTTGLTQVNRNTIILEERVRSFADIGVVRYANLTIDISIRNDIITVTRNERDASNWRFQHQRLDVEFPIEDTIVFTIGSTEAMVGNRSVTLERAPRIVYGNVYLPLGFVTATLFGSLSF